MGKNAFIEAEFLMDAEPVALPSKQLPNAGDQSPVSIASDIFMPEMKPITLPGAWTVVGKGGRPVKNAKMYDEPKQKKKKKKRARKAKNDEDESLFATLEELPSSSQCLYMEHRSAVRAEKVAVAGRQLKVWKRSKETKALRLMAREALLVDMFEEGLLSNDQAPLPATQLPASTGRHQHMGSHAEKKRRSVRKARQAAKCYEMEPEGVQVDDAFIGEPHRHVKRAAASVKRGAGAARAVVDQQSLQLLSSARKSPDKAKAGRMKRLRTASVKLGKSAAAAASPTGKQCLVM